MFDDITDFLRTRALPTAIGGVKETLRAEATIISSGIAYLSLLITTSLSIKSCKIRSTSIDFPSLTSNRSAWMSLLYRSIDAS